MTTEHEPKVGTLLDGRYEIQARVGEGGMGVVYRARQISIDRVIALKMLNSQMAQDPTWIQRFYNEAKACSRLQHPNTIRMFDFGQTQDGRLYMSMEFLDGISLRDALQDGPLPPQRVLKILIQCCASLAEAHSIGIIHRDIKPDNVFLLNMPGSPDFVKLLDFSVAKLLEGDRMKTQAGVVFGTPQYMSPEQARAMPLDTRSDLYALGVLAFEMLTGNVPFDDDNAMVVVHMQQSKPTPPLPQSVPFAVQQIVLHAMEKDPARRYQTASEMMQHCQQVFGELMQAPPPPQMQMQPPPQQMQTPPPSPDYGGYVASSPQHHTIMAQDGAYGPPASEAETFVASPQAPYGYPQAPPGYPQAQPGYPQMQPGYPQQPPQAAAYPYPQTYPVAAPGSRPSASALDSGAQQSRRLAAAPRPAAAAGASMLFWILSLAIGISLGVLAYVIVVQLS